jgi:large subunit ribosomal protein L15
MDLSSLVTVPGSKSKPKRVGRGKGSGLGQTSGKGHKGQLARTGGRVRRGFEGGQSPLSRRIPKRGFSNKDYATTYEVISVSKVLKTIPSGDITREAIFEAGLAKTSALIKIIGDKANNATDLTLARTFKVDKISSKLETQIVSSGGLVIKS